MARGAVKNVCKNSPLRKGKIDWGAGGVASCSSAKKGRETPFILLGSKGETALVKKRGSGGQRASSSPDQKSTCVPRAQTAGRQEVW